MAVRRQINRYKTEPYGSDEINVIKRAKQFFSSSGEFIITKYGNTYISSHPVVSTFKEPEGARHFVKKDDRWHEV